MLRSLRPQAGVVKRYQIMHGFRPFNERHRNKRVMTAYLFLMTKTSFGVRR